MAYLTDDERKELVAIARRAATSYIKVGKVPKETPPPGKLADPCAAFVTLTQKGRLRGCIGYTEALIPLFKTVQECAVAAATEDPRFPPVRPDEIETLHIEVSVLTPIVPIRPEDVEIGVHGLLMKKGGRRGLLLPQVAVEQGWDRLRFLSAVCEKAGLPGDAWRTGGELFSFTAEVFGE